jgi:hypothetical protein
MMSVVSTGTDGATITTLTSRAADIDSYEDSRKGKNVLALWIGTNDCASTAGATVYASLQTYVAARRAAAASAGVTLKIVFLTAMSRSDAGLNANYETNRLAFNALVRASGTSLADAIVDLGADSRFGVLGCELDTTYFNADKVHLNNTGCATIAPLVKAAIDWVL